MNYTFQEKGHIHLLEGKPLTGITTVLSVIAKPALIQWSANQAVEYIKEKWGTNGLITKELFEVLEEARYAHRKKKEEAGQKGTDVHAEIEKLIKLAINTSDGYVVRQNGEAELIPQVNHFVNWAIDNKVKFLESEAHIYSEKLYLGGICDFVCEIEGEVWIGDIKTGSAIYPEYFFQTAGYQLLFEDMGLYPNIKGHLILNLKKDGSFSEKRSVSNNENRDAFLAALTIYRTQEKLNNQII